MDPFVRNFIRASVSWLCLGVLLGLLMSVWPAALVVRPAHMHANLLGFVSMMIFGVAYHVLPRFTGVPLHAPRIAQLHFWIANGGLLLMVAGWTLRVWQVEAMRLVQAGGLLSAAGAFMFAYNVWRTLGAARPLGAPVIPTRR